MTPENLKPKFGNVQMNPLSPEQILRNLDHGFTMTRQEQSEAAQYIRQLQQENLTLLGKREWVGLTDDEKTAIFMQAEFNDLTERQMYDVVEAKLKEKNGAL